jgi:hypothetical protein
MKAEREWGEERRREKKDRMYEDKKDEVHSHTPPACGSGEKR